MRRSGEQLLAWAFRKRVEPVLQLAAWPLASPAPACLPSAPAISRLCCQRRLGDARQLLHECYAQLEDAPPNALLVWISLAVSAALVIPHCCCSRCCGAMRRFVTHPTPHPHLCSSLLCLSRRTGGQPRGWGRSQALDSVAAGQPPARRHSGWARGGLRGETRCWEDRQEIGSLAATASTWPCWEGGTHDCHASLACHAAGVNAAAGWTRQQYLTLLHLHVCEVLLAERGPAGAAAGPSCGQTEQSTQPCAQPCAALISPLGWHHMFTPTAVPAPMRLQRRPAGWRAPSCPLRQPSGSCCWTS